MLGAVDLTDLDMWARGVPYDEFSRLRREAPVAWFPDQDPATPWPSPFVLPTVSWHRDEYAALGVPFGRRGDILDEQLEIWTRAWHGSPISYRGNHPSREAAMAGHEPAYERLGEKVLSLPDVIAQPGRARSRCPAPRTISRCSPGDRRSAGSRWWWSTC